MFKNKTQIGLWVLTMILYSCVPTIQLRKANPLITDHFQNSTTDTLNTAYLPWQNFISDPMLKSLIDTALVNNQELNIILQKVAMAKNEIKAKKGEYLPFIDYRLGGEIEKVGEYTRNGVVEKNHSIKEGVEFPSPLSNFQVGVYTSWELDIWKKLRNAKKAAVMEYLSTVEGKKFMVTHLIAEISRSYYELMALDNQLEMIEQNLSIQQNVLDILKLQKTSAKANELAIKRFQAEMFKNKSYKYEIRQDIVEAENNINILLGRLPQHIKRQSNGFIKHSIRMPQAGIPAQLLENRSDVKQAEYELIASQLNVDVAKANFYPSLGIKAGLGLQGFNLKYLTQLPQSILFNAIGDITGPLVNRNAIKATYKNANAKQLKCIYEYEQAILKAYIEVSNALSNIDNIDQNYSLKEDQVQILTESIKISNQLFQSARADYMEVLLTQRDALESKIELIETKKKQFQAQVELYLSLGGGWRNI